MHRHVAVELPIDALTEEEKERDLVGILDMSLYGARDAAVNFQKEVGKLMRALGFIQSKNNAIIFYHQYDDVKVLVHGNDFVASGRRAKIQKFKENLARRFTIKKQDSRIRCLHCGWPRLC